MADELKPCPNPWCTATSKPMRVLSQSHMEVGYAIRCACGVISPQAETAEEALAAWNTRTSERTNAALLGAAKCATEPWTEPIREGYVLWSDWKRPTRLG